MFKDSVEKFYPEMEAIRDDIHMHPELSNQEFRTSALVIDQLRSYGLDSVEQIANTGVVGLLRGEGGEGKCIAIRADMVSPLPSSLGKARELPMTIMTAIVSPMARPVANAMEIRMPRIDAGSTS